MAKVNIVAIRTKKKHYYPNSGQAHKYTPNAQLSKEALMNPIKRQRPNTNLLMYYSDQDVDIQLLITDTPSEIK